jgi:hypothetical protein
VVRLPLAVQPKGWQNGKKIEFREKKFILGSQKNLKRWDKINVSSINVTF